MEGEKYFGSAAILAGGQSLRMGFDKQLINFREKPLFEHILRSLSPHFSDLMVVTYRPELYADYPVRPVQDFYGSSGPLAGIHSALCHAKSSYVYLVACDMPYFDSAYAKYMEKQIERYRYRHDACITRKGGWIEPFHGYYSKGCLPVIEEDLSCSKTSIRYFLNKVDVHYVPESKARQYSPDWSLFLNINTKELYEEYARVSG